MLDPPRSVVDLFRGHGRAPRSQPSLPIRRRKRRARSIEGLERPEERTLLSASEAFTLACYPGGGTGIIQQPASQSSPSSFDIPVNIADPTEVYTLINSVFGEYGDTVGAGEFEATGGLIDTVDLVEGQNVRDHNNGNNNTIATGALGSTYVGTASYGGGQVRLDEQGFTLPAAFQSATLTDIVFLGYGNTPDGQPFLAAATVATSNGPVSVNFNSLVSVNLQTYTNGGDYPLGGTIVTLCPDPAAVYLDSAWAGDANGTTVTWPADSSTHIIGYDAFSTIHAGVNGVAYDGTVDVASGTYNETVTIGRDLVLAGAGANFVTVDGDMSGSVFTVDTGAMVISDVAVTQTLTDCTVSGNSAQSFGGGLLNVGMALLVDCDFTANSAGNYGGGMSNGAGTASLSGCTFSGNSAGALGGGISVQAGAVTIESSWITGNSSGYQGGGLAVNGGASLTMNNVTVSGNTSVNGGGVFNVGTVTFIDCTFLNNYAQEPGGGMQNSGTATLDECIISGNLAGRNGGGADNDIGTTTLTECTISGNSAIGTGRGVQSALGTETLIDCNVASNSARYEGGGLFNWGTVTLKGCDFTDNWASVSGGGVSNTGGQASLSGCHLSGNSAGSNGGGIAVFGGALTITCSSVTGNVSGKGGGLFVCRGVFQGTYFNGSFAMDDVTVSGNSAASGGGIFNEGTTIATDSTIADNIATNGGGLSNEGSGTPPDIGAYQSQGFTLTAVNGSTPQSAPVGTAFANPLAVTVTANDPLEPVAGGMIIFETQPAGNGASAILASGTATIGADGVAGVAALANDTAGNYVVAAAADVVALPASFSLTNLAAITSIVAQPPAGVLADNTLGVTVDELNAQGQIDTSYNDCVTVSLANNPGNSILGGILNVQAVNGVATFSGLTISNPSLAYTRGVSASGAVPITTSSFDVAGYQLVASGSAENLVWSGTSGSDQVRFTQTATDTAQITVSDLAGIATSFTTTVTGVTGNVVVNEYDVSGDTDVIDGGGLTTIASVISVGDGNDTLIGGGGANTITAGNGDNTIYGNGIGYSQIGDVEDLSNTITVGNGNGNGNKIIYGNLGGTGDQGGDNAITAGNGNNTIYGNYGVANYQIDGAEGANNTITVGNGNNTIYGNYGNADGGEGGNFDLARHGAGGVGLVGQLRHTGG